MHPHVFRFITPHHSEGNAPAERLLGTVKRLIAKVAADHPKSWHQHLPFVLRALWEVPSELTGIPPWLLAMGTLPRGPLAVLRETWTGERDCPPSLEKQLMTIFVSCTRTLKLLVLMHICMLNR